MSFEKPIKDVIEAQAYPKFICIYGPDGAGKTTHTEIISQHFATLGLKVKKVWVRGPHTLAFILSSILLRFGMSREILNPYNHSKKIPKIGPHPLVKKTWTIIEFLSVLPIVFFNVILPLKTGYTILADRYILDTITLIAYYINDINFTHGRISRVLISLIPHCSLFFHLDADYDELIKRRGKKVEPQEFIEFQKKSYAILSKMIASYKIDTSDISINQVSLLMLKNIKDYNQLYTNN
jgi:thymidylate kinase